MKHDWFAILATEILFMSSPNNTSAKQKIKGKRIIRKIKIYHMVHNLFLM